MRNIFLILLLCINCQITFAQEKPAFDNQCRIPHYAFTLNCLTLPANTFGANTPFDVQVYQVDARVRYPKPSPVIWLPDGLGLVPNERAPAMISLLSRLRNFRALMWLSLQPTKHMPALTCEPEHASPPAFNARIYRLNDTLLLTQCIKTIESLGGVKQVDYVAIAQIYERMAQQLHLQQVTVVAEGRGALIAKAWQTIAPNRIKFAVFDSPPRLPNAQEAKQQAEANAHALQKVFEACSHQPSCQSQFKHQVADWLALVQSLPVSTMVKNPMTLKTSHLTITADMLALWTSQLLGNPSKARYLPLLLSHALADDWQPFIGMLTYSLQNKQSPVNYALAIAEQCAYRSRIKTGEIKTDKIKANKPLATNKNLTNTNALAYWFYQSKLARDQAVCKGLAPYQPKALSWQAHTKLPTLVLMGMANPSIPKQWPTMEKNWVVQAPGAGHGLINYGCTRDVITRYFKWQDDTASGKKAKAFEADCLLKLPYPAMTFIDPKPLTKHSISPQIQSDGAAP